jgi:hypothetical protein
VLVLVVQNISMIVSEGHLAVMVVVGAAFHEIEGLLFDLAAVQKHRVEGNHVHGQLLPRGYDLVPLFLGPFQLARQVHHLLLFGVLKHHLCL